MPRKNLNLLFPVPQHDKGVRRLLRRLWCEGVKGQEDSPGGFSHTVRPWGEIVEQQLTRPLEKEKEEEEEEEEPQSEEEDETVKDEMLPQGKLDGLNLQEREAMVILLRDTVKVDMDKGLNVLRIVQKQLQDCKFTKMEKKDIRIGKRH